MAQRPKLVIYGASGYAVAIRDMMMHGLGAGAREPAAFIDDFRGDRGEAIDGVPVIGFETWRAHYRHLPCVITIGDPESRRAIAERVAEAGGHFCAVYHIQGAISPAIAVGEGTLIGYPVHVGPYTVFGKHVQVMPLCAIGHDVTIGDCVTIGSSATIAGHVAIEDDVFVGAGAVIVNGTAERPKRIGRGAVISAGAVVTKSVSQGARVAGNPARDLRTLARRTRRA